MRQYDWSNDFDFAVSPGRLLESTLESHTVSREELALRCECTLEYLDEIINNEILVEPEIAIKIERVLGIPAHIIMKHEDRFRFHLARTIEVEEATNSNGWLAALPNNNLITRGEEVRTSVVEEKFTNSLEFFGVGSVDAWNENYQSPKIAYRHAKSFKSDFYCLATWLRLGEIRAGEKFRAIRRMKSNNEVPKGTLYGQFDKSNFKEAMKDVRTLTRRPVSNVLSEIERICDEVGVYFVLVAPVPKISVSGAAWWLKPDKPVIQLNTRHKTEDQFWFSFFHEVAHIILHNKKEVFVDGKRSDDGRLERQANEWASNVLVPKRAWKKFTALGKFGLEDVLSFAKELQVAPGIVVDKLQVTRFVKPRKFNDLKVQLEELPESSFK